MELIYSVKHIFDDSTQQGCLSQYNVIKFHIPAYQRGYKWSSNTNGAVTILLNDLWEAFNKSPDKEYYLQYITVKQNTKEKYLELIDGQQRITTLSILLSVCAQLFNTENLTKNKLHYAVRSSFFNDFFFNNTNLNQLINTKDWSSFISDEEEYNKQDIFHFYEAAKKVNSFIKGETKNSNDFYNFILNNVKVIVNAVEEHIESETVFKNLNSNKVPLTEVELIKGLFITRVGRSYKNTNSKSFIEISETRARIGQQWDEITNWANTPEISSFYFNGKTGMHQLLSLVAICKGYKTKGNKADFPLFNFFLNEGDFVVVFDNLLYTYRILTDWFYNNNKYHLIGFVRFVKNSKCNTLVFLSELLKLQTKTELVNHLKEKRAKLIKGDIKLLRYGDDDDKIHAILLYLNIFHKELKEGKESNQSTFRYDFCAFIKEKWTLEHIFPQSPEGKKAVLTENNKKEIYEILGGRETLDLEILEILAKDKRDESEKEKYYKLLQSADYLNSIGNMCLLTGSDNSSNGCMFFKEKRVNMLKRIQKGSFVPKHTFDVFSKMISGIEKHDIETWNKEDIKKHLIWISTNINEVAL